ncbi:MAG: IPT/TIG domain-containing protein, partial [Patescibacteria group bacterium]|nr:IPT/TIG domain-containing protein [Patescibacteria group bacterium]
VNYTYIDEDTDDGDGNMTISYLSPSSGRADQTVVVTIYGSGFSDSQGSVRFGQWDATIVSWTDGQIRVNAPVLGSISSDVTYPVMVTQGSDSASSYYTYLAPGSTGGSGATNGTGTTPDTGLPTVAWLGLITVNGGLAFVAKRKLFA